MIKRVVVTGLGAITPVGNTVETFFDSLCCGRHGIGFITRFDSEGFKTRIAAEVKGFDPYEYIPKPEARRMDMYSQYAAAAAAQAVSDSGISGTVPAERFGVYVGSGIGGMETLISEAKKYFDGGPRKVSPFFIPMMISNIAAGNIAIKYGAMGPSLPIVTACATSNNTLGEAYRTIRHGYADAIIAGGSEAAINPLSMAGFINCMALTTRNNPDEASIPFDKRRDGFVMGEGAGMLVLEEYEHAKARGAKIYAEICGYGNTNDANHITAPHPEGKGAVAAIKLALKEAGYTPETPVYVNAHGTSTPMNDRIETRALKLAFGEDAAGRLKISSTKSMTGHTLGAAGAIEAVASILALNKGIIPPTIGYKEPDPDCDLDYTPNHSVSFDAQLAVSCSFGFGGHNAVVAFRKV